MDNKESPILYRDTSLNILFFISKYWLLRFLSLHLINDDDKINEATVSKCWKPSAYGRFYRDADKRNKKKLVKTSFNAVS